MLAKSVATSLTLLVILAVGWKTVVGRATGVSCSSKVIQDGMCMAVGECPSLLPLIVTLLKIRPIPEILAQYGCGRDRGGTVHVCCPTIENNPENPRLIPEEILEGNPSTKPANGIPSPPLIVFDSRPETCNVGEFLCESRDKCITDNWICDGDNDCTDGSDEIGCPVTLETCNVGEFLCESRDKCITDNWICDGDNDCTYGSDEIGCPVTLFETCNVGEFLCESRDKCITDNWICDGDNDCTDGSDEIGCPVILRPCIVGESLCDSGNKDTVLPEISPALETLVALVEPRRR